MPLAPVGPTTPIVFELTCGGAKLRVASFRGVEELSSNYAYEFVLHADASEAPAFADVLGHPAALAIFDGDVPRFVHGIVSEFEVGAQAKKHVQYRAVLVPATWKLDGRRDNRIFQELSTPDIVKKVFDGGGLDGCTLRLDLQGSYRPREYCVQYRESDWAFISRLLEEEGIYFFFEHAEEGHTLVLADKPAAHAPIAGNPVIPFRPPVGALVSSEHVSQFRYREAVRPGKVTLRDYNFKKPSLNLESQGEATADADIEVYDYPGDYDEPGDGTSLAKVRLEHWQAQRKVGSGEAACTRLTLGATFSLLEHPSEEFNRSWLLTRIEQEGSMPLMGEGGGTAGDYRTRFLCIPDDVQFRPALRTQRPRIYGVQTAIVVGPAGEEIYPDEHARVKVQFHWDRLGKKDEKSSCWIRVSQLWAGAGWGAMQIPRIGQEVVVEFLEGDPDRPLIVGRVYHGTNVPPYVLPAEKTKSTIRSDSTPGGGGFNELMFEDGKGKEEIFLHAQKDWTIGVENDKTQTVGHDEKLTVAHDRTKEVEHDQKEKVGNDKSIAVGGSHSESIAKAEAITVGAASDHTVGGALTENVGGAKSSTVGGALTEIIGKDMKVTIGAAKQQSIAGAFKESVGGDLELAVSGKHQLSVTKDMSVTASANLATEVGKEQTTNVGDAYSVVVGDGKLTIKKNGDITLEGKEIHITGTGPVYVKGSKLQVTSDGTVDVKASGAVKVKGSAVEIN
ncbi:MAG: type VI secretion system tip protein VgrG [Myxococcales bacterium]|nr:type VI secretion system tip protein VgrG [Myxococcales bacterium]